MKTVASWIAASTFLLLSVAVRADELDLLTGVGLEQWVNADGSPVDRPQWQLADGILHLTGGGGGDIYFRETVADFRLSFEWKISPRGNSGVKYRVRQYGASWLGCEYQIEDRAADAPLADQSTGALYAVYEPNSSGHALPAGEWNRSTIMVKGNRIEHWLNGGRVVSAEVGSPDWRERVARSKFAPHAGWGENRTGRLMLQDHGNEVWFRNLRLTRLNEWVTVPSSTIGHVANVSSNPCCNSYESIVCQPERNWSARRIGRLRRCR